MTHSQKLTYEIAMAGGTITGFLVSYGPDIAKTIICSIIGAGTSFVVTLFLKWLSKKIFKK